MFEQDRFIVRLQQRVQRDYAVRACLLTGSFGRKTNDPYSDIDVTLVYADDGERDRAWDARQSFAESVLPYVSVKSVDASQHGDHWHSALYSNGAKADYRFASQTSFRPTYWERDIVILKDSAGWAEGVQQQAQQLLPAQARTSAAELAALDNQFWVTFWDIFRQVKRGDTVKPYATYVQLIATTLPPLIQLLPPEHAAHQALIDIHYAQSAAVTLAGLQRLLTAYRGARSAVVSRYGIAFTPDGGFERALDRHLR